MWSIQLYHNMDFWGILIQCHKDLVKIVRWDLSNYHALKAGFNRFNYHMFCFRATRKVTIQTSQLNLWGFCVTKSSATEPSHQAIWWQPPGVAAPSDLSDFQNKASPAPPNCIALFGQILRLVDMVLSRATIEGGPENREAPGGGGISLLWKRNSWGWPMA